MKAEDAIDKDYSYFLKWTSSDKHVEELNKGRIPGVVLARFLADEYSIKLDAPTWLAFIVGQKLAAHVFSQLPSMEQSALKMLVGRTE